MVAPMIVKRVFGHLVPGSGSRPSHGSTPTPTPSRGATGRASVLLGIRRRRLSVGVTSV